jgi:hypothetical protein
MTRADKWATIDLLLQTACLLGGVWWLVNL